MQNAELDQKEVKLINELAIWTSNKTDTELEQTFLGGWCKESNEQNPNKDASENTSKLFIIFSTLTSLDPIRRRILTK